jgi:hypothetical protein
MAAPLAPLIKSTICRSGYTATVRPPSSYTTNLKQQQMARKLST